MTDRRAEISTDLVAASESTVKLYRSLTPEQLQYVVYTEEVTGPRVRC